MKARKSLASTSDGQGYFLILKHIHIIHTLALKELGWLRVWPTKDSVNTGIQLFLGMSLGLRKAEKLGFKKKKKKGGTLILHSGVKLQTFLRLLCD